MQTSGVELPREVGGGQELQTSVVIWQRDPDQGDLGFLLQEILENWSILPGFSVSDFYYNVHSMAIFIYNVTMSFYSLQSNE